MTSTELCQLTACQQKTRFDRGQTSAAELLEAHLRQIEQVNPDINAVITLNAEAALEQAFVIDRKKLIASHSVRSLGYPWLIKT